MSDVPVRDGRNGPWDSVRGYLLVLGVTVVASIVLDQARVPSPVLFGGLLGGMAYALTSARRLELPEPVFRVGQALLGVVMGTTVSLQALRAMGGSWATIALVTLGTLAISLAAGAVLARRRDVGAATGAFAMVAGGASGVVAVARQLGADERVVTVVQYLRVLIVLLAMPLVTTLAFDPERGAGVAAVTDSRLGPSLLYVAVALAGGLVLARLLRFSTAILLAPLFVGAVIVDQGWFGAVTVPAAVQWLGFALIGMQVGLRFTRESLVSIARMLPAVVAIILGMIAVTALMGAALAALTPIDGLTAYLATTPGGLFAVLATATDAGADATYVMAVQTVRLLAVLALAPLLARWFARRA
jgi:uncharacterized protein